jgi:hypothetical protein
MKTILIIRDKHMVSPQGTNKLSDRLKIHTKDASSISNKDQAIMETCAEINTIPKTSINERLKMKNINGDMTNDGQDNNTENEEKNTQIKQDNQIIEKQTPETKIQIASTFDVQPTTFTNQLGNSQSSKTETDQKLADWFNGPQQTTNWLNEIQEDKKEKNKKGIKTNKNYNKDINERKKEIQRENF